MAISKEDVKNKLLADEHLYAAAEDGDVQLFHIPAGGELTRKVRLIGKAGGGTKKADRLLPEIHVIFV